MQNIEKVLNFEEFRQSHDDVLQRQREALENDAIANEILADGGGMSGWRQWDSNVLAFES